MDSEPSARLTLLRSKDAALLSGSLRDGRRFTRVRRGVYVDASAWDRLKPWERYRARVEAVLATWDSPVLCLESAAVYLGLPIFGEPRDIHLLDVGGKSRRYGDVVVHATREDGGVRATKFGVKTTGLPETALACAVFYHRRWVWPSQTVERACSRPRRALSTCRI